MPSTASALPEAGVGLQRCSGRRLERNWPQAPVNSGCAAITSVASASPTRAPEWRHTRMKLFFGFVLLAAHTLTSWASTTEAIPLRLPNTIAPTAYRLALQVDPNQTKH